MDFKSFLDPRAMVSSDGSGTSYIDTISPWGSSIDEGLSSFLDPFGAKARTKGVNNANSAIQQAANEFDLRTGNIDYNVSPAMVNSYMSPDVAFRQNAATQGLAQIYGNSGALRSSAAQSGIANTNAAIAAQAWNDAFGRASGVLGKNNNLELLRAQNMQNAKQGMAANILSKAMNEKGAAGDAFGAVGNIFSFLK